MKRWVIGAICSFLIIFISLVSGIQFSNGWTIGDYLFKFMNQPSWSGGTSGTHYSIIATLILLLVGVIGLRFSLETAPPQLAKKLNIITLILVLCWPFFTYAGEQLVMRCSKGINAIEYDIGRSTCNFRDEGNSRILVTAEIQLINHGESPVEFHMEIKPPSNNGDIERYFGGGFVLKNKDNEIESFILNPKEARTLRIESYAVNSSSLHMSGSMSNPRLVIFNEQGEITFAK